MAVVNVKDEQIKKVLVTTPEQLLELAEKLAPGLKDAILEFFVAKKSIPEEALKILDDYEGPDEDLEAGMDNEYFEDNGDPV